MDEEFYRIFNAVCDAMEQGREIKIIFKDGMVLPREKVKSIDGISGFFFFAELSKEGAEIISALDLAEEEISAGYIAEFSFFAVKDIVFL